MQQSYIIGVSGGSGSGKSTLARALCEFWTTKNAIVIDQDSYYCDQSHLSIEERNKLNFDEPNSVDFALLFNQIKELRNNRSIKKPSYSFKNHVRVKKTTKIKPHKFIIVEGILIYTYSKLLKLFDLKIFLNIEADIRLLRRINRDCNERGRTLKNVITQYLDTVKPMHEKYVSPIMQNADLIFTKNSISEQIETINNCIKKMSNHN